MENASGAEVGIAVRSTGAMRCNLAGCAGCEARYRNCRWHEHVTGPYSAQDLLQAEVISSFIHHCRFATEDDPLEK